MLQRGFSILELLLVLAIFGIMLLVSMPYARDLLGKNRALTYANELRSALQFARISAIRLDESVIFCGSKNHKECDNLWQEGAIVITSRGRVLRVLPKISSGDKLIWCGGAIAKERITFLPREFLYGQQGSFYYCPKSSPGDGLAVILWVTGRVRIGKIQLKDFVSGQNPSISCDQDFIVSTN